LTPRRAGFTRAQRLTTSADFDRVFGQADRSADQYFTVLSRPNRKTEARLGLTISRRAARKAVDRNRLKRIARETFRELDLDALDFVVMARRAAVEADNATLRRSLDRHFRRLTEKAGAGRDG
jgi:ribonuclease P protein component